MLGNQMSSGQAAAVGQANQAGQYGVNAGNLMGQAGQSMAAGQMGAANTMGNALASMGSMYQQQQQQNQNQANFNRMFPSSVSNFNVPLPGATNFMGPV
jgi:hypothetical protein